MTNLEQIAKEVAEQVAPFVGGKMNPKPLLYDCESAILAALKSVAEQKDAEAAALLRELESLRAAKSHMESCRTLIGARNDETLYDAISALRERVSHPIATVISNEQAARIIVSLADLPAVVRVLNSLTDPRDSAYIDLRRDNAALCAENDKLTVALKNWNDGMKAALEATAGQKGSE